MVRARRHRLHGIRRCRRAHLDPERRITLLNQADGIAFFGTALGVCGVAWSARGLASVQLPESSDAATRARLRTRYPAAAEAEPPPSVQRVIDAIVELLRSGRADFGDVDLDRSAVGEFEWRAYALARRIPPGCTRTYGEIAAALGEPGAARAVGQAMGHNPWPLVVPCHRVLAADGSLGGFSAAGGVATKRRLLAIEGAEAARQISLPLAGESPGVGSGGVD